jgi:hypothetical protein
VLGLCCGLCCGTACWRSILCDTTIPSFLCEFSASSC